MLLPADDMRADSIAVLGNPTVKTPNLDSLVRSVFVFRNAHCLGSNSPAVCLPSRNVLPSGRAYFRWDGAYAPDSPPNFPLSMAGAGYETYHHGKRGNVAVESEKRSEHSRYLKDDEERSCGRTDSTIVDGAIEFIRFREGRREERPFFLRPPSNTPTIPA